MRVSFVPTLFVGVLLAITIGCGPPKPAAELSEYSSLQDFCFTDQNDSAFCSKDVENKVVVASFVFTSCTTACPVLTQRMALVEQCFEAEDGVTFVSFSIDPMTDTPERLKEYAAKFKLDSSNWTFLTGDMDTLNVFIEKSFLLGTGTVVKPEGIDSVDYVHSNKLVVVDKSGTVRYYADGLEANSVNLVTDAVRQLLD
jgi:protein SCO1/2